LQFQCWKILCRLWMVMKSSLIVEFQLRMASISISNFPVFMFRSSLSSR
jgi:hypothetical protein